MKKVELTEVEALQLYKESSDNGRVVLIQKFGKELFADKNNVFEAACAKLGKDPVKELPWSNPIDAEQEADNAFVMLRIIVKAKVGDWVPDWTKSSQYKWFPVFDMAGFGFSRSSYVHSYSYAFVGSRLCLPTEEMADEHGRECEHLYKKLLTK